MDEPYLPSSSEELIELLDVTFPDKCPDLKDSERLIFFNAGRRSLVDWLKDLKTRTEEHQLHSVMEK